MGKYLKRYNVEKGKWEVISSPDETIIQILPDGSDVKDTNVVVTNYNYVDESGETRTLDDTLSIINNDIEKLQRNVSWLAEHGGGGSSGGGGGTSNYGIVVLSPALTNNSVYITDTSLTVKFTITGGTIGDKFLWKYTFDGVNPSDPKSLDYGATATFDITNINSVTTATTHTLKIEAEEPDYGITIVPFTFYIYESSLSFGLNTDREGTEINDIVNGEVLLAIDDTKKNVYFNIKNTIEDSRTTIHSETSAAATSNTYTNTSLTTTKIAIPFTDILKSVEANVLYSVSNYAQVTYTVGGIQQTITSPTIVVPVRIKDSNNFSIYFDGLTYDTDDKYTEISSGNTLFFTFKAYAPYSVTGNSMYYAVSLKSNKTGFEEEFITGSTFDDASYNLNPSNRLKTPIPIQIPITNPDFWVRRDEDDYWIITVKGWTQNGDYSGITRGCYYITEENRQIFPRQYNAYNTVALDVVPDTNLFCWASSSKMSGSTWISKIQSEYTDMAGNSALTVEGNITLYSTNGKNSGFITDTVPAYLRLQNEAYAIADLSDGNYITGITNNNYRGQGFDISFTFTPDEMYDNNKVALLWGKNNSDGTLNGGIKVNLDKATWVINDTTTLISHIRPGNKTTLDFAYDGANAYIYVNGVMDAFKYNVVPDEDKVYKTASIGCDIISNVPTDFSDINVYEFAIYTKALTPLQIAINSKNARIGDPLDPLVIEDYNQWMIKNLIYRKTDPSGVSINVPYCYIMSGKEYVTPSDLSSLKNASPIPVLTIDARNSSDFTEVYFHKDYSDTPSVTGVTHVSTTEYYDPVTKTSTVFNSLISLQGTSTLGYWSKNLELYVNEFCTDNPQLPRLFQPKSDWFPEKQFTLKADVIDSAHANNSTIGEWINNCNIFGKNPVQELFASEELKSIYSPKDYASSSATTPRTHTSSIDGVSEINYDEKLTVKSTLEGFPVLLVMYFKDGSGPQILGIYSFNLGRYSYYNMGMKFLKKYARPSITPAIIDFYEETQTLSNISASNVYSYEFNAYADDNKLEHNTWTQHDPSILKHYGEFRYKGTETDAIWDKLSDLFEKTAIIAIPDFEGVGTTATNYFGTKYKYTYENGDFVKGTSQYTLSLNNAEFLSGGKYINSQNAIGYFIVAILFGMVDSLGKNLTLRTWDGGDTWYTCFYDMDTALALSNAGEEGISETVYVDNFSTNTPPDGISRLVIDYYAGPPSGSTTESSGIYNAYLSKLWALYRSLQVRYIIDGERSNTTYYQDAWTMLRNANTGSLKIYSDFIEEIENKIGTCGELIYNYDYSEKYVGGNGKNAGLFHGIRIEYIREWLKKRVNFLDGVFFTSDGYWSGSSIHNSAFNMTSYGNANRVGNYIGYRFNTTVSTFIRINVGATSDADDVVYYLPAYTDTDIHLASYDSEKQTKFTSSNLLTKFEGLDNCQFISANKNVDDGSLSSLVSFSVAGATTLGNEPMDTRIFLDNGLTALERIDFSNTSFVSSTSTGLTLDLTNLTKLKYVDVSNSPTTTLLLPNSVLQVLSFKNTKIKTLTISDQPLLNNLDYSGCTALNNTTISKCDAITSVTFDGENGLTILSAISISQCALLDTVTILNCNSLENIALVNNPNLKNIIISGCTNENLKIEIYGSPIETIRICGMVSDEPVILPAKAYLSGVTLIDLTSSYNFAGFSFNGEEVEKYSGTTDYILNVSPFSSLDNSDGNALILTNVRTMKYLRVANEIEHPFNIYSRTIAGSSELVRIFGHIGLSSSYLFSNFSNFELNGSYEDGYPWMDGEYVTNITVLGDDMTGVFSGTKVNFDDALYFLHKCNSGVTTLNTTFLNCQNVVTNDGILTDIFENCTNVENIDAIFSGCKINGLLSSSTLSTIGKNLTSFINVFSGDYSIDADQETNPFFPSGNGIAILTGFNPKGEIVEDGMPQGKTEFYDNGLLTNLTCLEEMSFSYCNCMIYDNGDDGFRVFQNTPKLRTITSSFRDLECSENFSFKHIFGGGVEDGNFPTGITRIVDSFHARSGDGVIFPIGNSLFSKISSTIEVVSGRCFTGNIKKIIDTNDLNDGELFPYDVFAGCSKLSVVENLFQGIEFEGGTEEIIELPRSMFNDCTGLTSLTHFFDGMKGFNYRLTPDGFKNLHLLENVSYIFAETLGGAGKVNLPPRLFYQESSITADTKYGIMASDVTWVDTESGRTYVNESGRTIIVIDSETEVDVTDLINSYTHSYTGACGTITTMEGAFMNSTNAKIGHYEMANEYSGYTIENNPDYSPFKYVVTEDGFYLNHHTGTTVLSKYMYDGSVDYITKVVGYGISLVGVDTYDVEKLIENTQRERNVNSANTGFEISVNFPKTLMDSTNFICPPDIFRYCANDAATNVNSSLANSSIEIKSTTTNNNYRGIIGTIPSYLLEPISNIYSFNRVFYGDEIIPTKWDFVDESSVATLGDMYPENLFSYSNEIRSIFELFGGTHIWGNVCVPRNFITNASKLQSVSGLWTMARMVYGNYDLYKLPITLFYSSRELSSVSNMISMSSIRNVSAMFNPANNPKLSDCSSFMERCQTATAEGINAVPPFWLWSANVMRLYKNAYTGAQNIVSVITAQGASSDAYKFYQKTIS